MGVWGAWLEPSPHPTQALHSKHPSLFLLGYHYPAHEAWLQALPREAKRLSQAVIRHYQHLSKDLGQP
ncbi:MAG: hypothetical protein R2880_21020 [Deinococcales bacterium]